MIHLDLFAGIGGFSIASDEVFGDMEHVFVEWDKFCQQVLKKHWPEAKIYGDIRQFTTYPISDKRVAGTAESPQRQTSQRQQAAEEPRRHERPFLLTGGFPCQPFSAAGLRRGTDDERHLWPEMLRVIRLTQPEWVIAENVRGLATWNDGMVLEQVCTDLEAEGYEVQPLIIPAVAVNAPHRRDRIWFVAHTKRGADGGTPGQYGSKAEEERHEVGQPGEPDTIRDVTDPASIGREPGGIENRPQNQKVGSQGQRKNRRPGIPDWGRDWTEVAAELCSLDDGLPVALDGFELSKSQHRKEQLKAYGNAIVPQVAMEIMRAMKETTP